MAQQQRMTLSDVVVTASIRKVQYLDSISFALQISNQVAT